MIRTFSKSKFIIVTNATTLLMVSILVSSDIYASEQTNKKQYISTGIAAPLNGTLYLAYGRPISTRLLLAHYGAYFQREWMLPLEQGDWISNSGYLGIQIKYYPYSERNTFNGLFIGGDIGYGGSLQKYRPLNKSQFVFFPYLELYCVGFSCKIPFLKNMKIEGCIGGGYAPLSKVVNIEGITNEGDYYPLFNFEVSYWW